MEQVVETNYVVLDKPYVCESEKNGRDDLLIAVKSAPGNYEQREVLRETWLFEAKQQRIPYIFVLGATTDEQLLSEILEEDENYGDLLIGKPVDNYNNLTLKLVFLLAWTKTYCPTHWLFYVDDDTIVNVYNAISFVAAKKNVTDDVLYCQTMAPQQVLRDPESKWFVPKSIWKEDYYLNYCSGNGYMIPSRTIPLLHRTAKNESCRPKLYIDDVFVTGIATAAAGIKLIESSFLCCMNGNTKEFNVSVSLGQMGKGDALLANWENIRGNSTLNDTAEEETVLSKHQTSRFSREGYYITDKIHTTEKLFRFLITKTDIPYLRHYPYWLVIAVSIVIIVLYSKTSRRLRSFRSI